MSWTNAIQQAITSPKRLCELLDLPWSQYEKHYQHNPLFSLKIPLPFVQRMQKGNWHDPLLRQVLSPIAQPFSAASKAFLTDPLQENNPDSTDNPLPGVLQKYAHRVLILATGSCAIHCQYCFRQHFPYSEQAVGTDLWQAILAFLRKRSDIHEIIFSGGDPLMRSDANWHTWLQQLAEIPHVHTVRWHSRLPVVIPERLTDGWLEAAVSTRLRPVLVLHSNHPQEWDQALQHAAHKAVQKGITVLNQGVILSGINNTAECLIQMSWTLWSAQVLPYYWHLLDPVIGAEAYATALSGETIRSWEAALRKNLPGYLVPRIVQEIPGTDSKQLV